jgi:hypothetical protein
MLIHPPFIRVLALAALGAGFLACTAAASDKVILTLVERATTDSVADTGKKGDSVGDVLAFANELYDQANATLVGHDNGWCVRTAVGKAWECVWTVLLDRGQLTVEGPFYDSGDSVLAITGGTGKYANAHGEMNLRARDAKGSAYDFAFNLSH